MRPGASRGSAPTRSPHVGAMSSSPPSPQGPGAPLIQAQKVWVGETVGTRLLVSALPEQTHEIKKSVSIAITRNNAFRAMRPGASRGSAPTRSPHVGAMSSSPPSPQVPGAPLIQAQKVCVGEACLHVPLFPEQMHEIEKSMFIIANDAHYNHRHRLCRCLWIPTKGALARPTGNQYIPVRKSVSSGADFRVSSPLAQNPQILRDTITMYRFRRWG